MSIVLKTDPKWLRTKLEDEAGVFMTVEGFNAVVHDVRYAHAMQMAIEEGKVEARNASDPLVTADWLAAINWINERAAANLARLRGEGNV